MGGPLFQIIEFTSSRVDIDTFMERHYFDLDGDLVAAPKDVLTNNTEPFLRTSPVVAKWNVKDIAVEISECHVYAGFASILKFMQAQNAVLRLVDRVMLEMALNKYFPEQPPSKPIPESSEIAVHITTLHVDLLLKDLDEDVCLYEDSGSPNDSNVLSRDTSAVKSRPISTSNQRVRSVSGSEVKDIRSSPTDMFTSPPSDRVAIGKLSSNNSPNEENVRSMWDRYQNNNKKREYLILFGDFKAVLKGGDSTYAWGIGDIYLNGRMIHLLIHA